MFFKQPVCLYVASSQTEHICSLQKHYLLTFCPGDGLLSAWGPRYSRPSLKDEQRPAQLLRFLVSPVSQPPKAPQGRNVRANSLVLEKIPMYTTRWQKLVYVSQKKVNRSLSSVCQNFQTTLTSIAHMAQSFYLSAWSHFACKVSSKCVYVVSVWFVFFLWLDTSRVLNMSHTKFKIFTELVKTLTKNSLHIYFPSVIPNFSSQQRASVDSLRN